MARFFIFLRSAAKPGRAQDYSEWCRKRHLPDLMDVPGVVALKRFRDIDPPGDGDQPRFVTMFELDCDNPRDIVAEFGRRMASGQMDSSDSYDPASVTMQFVQVECEEGVMFQD